jgi:hypothetical protein
MEDEESVGWILFGHDVFPESLKFLFSWQFAEDSKGF